MIKKLCAIGNSVGLVIDRAVLDLMGWSRDSEVEVTARDGGLFIRPITQDDHKARVRRSAARVAKIHRKTLRKLAE